jgi:hypothetical protein
MKDNKLTHTSNTHKTAKDSQDRTERAGQSGQRCQKRDFGTGLLDTTKDRGWSEHGSKDKTGGRTG